LPRKTAKLLRRHDPKKMAELGFEEGIGFIPFAALDGEPSEKYGFCGSLGQKATSGIPETFPVTKSSDNPFIPPSPYPTVPYPGSSWFGTDELWTVPPEAWKGLGHYTPTDPVQRRGSGPVPETF
jgi:hypothetical protein